jgi:predicted short-subunit dehydrogenase-like oxidoreductase (DUF2520 family)
VILLVGAGKLGLHLAGALAEKAISPLQVWSRSGRNDRLAGTGSVEWFDDPKALSPRPELCLLCVPDGAIAEVAEKLRDVLSPDTPVAHTSGTTPGSVLAPFFPHYGVWYPLQTFSPGQRVDWQQVPILVHGSDSGTADALWALAQRLSGHVVRADDAQRASVHLAAVFANNFTNHLFHIAERICAENQVDFRILLPLIEATVQKIRYLSPAEAQTGPVVRGDLQTLARHAEHLAEHPHWGELYRLLSEDIARERQPPKQ